MALLIGIGFFLVGLAQLRQAGVRDFKMWLPGPQAAYTSAKFDVIYPNALAVGQVDGKYIADGGSAAWLLELSVPIRLARNAASSRCFVFVEGTDLRAFRRAGRATISVNGSRLDSIVLGSKDVGRERISFRPTPSLPTVALRYAPLDYRLVYMVPVPLGALSDRTLLSVSIRGPGVWPVRTAGVLVRFVPRASPALPSRTILFIVACALLCGLVAGVAASIAGLSREMSSWSGACAVALFVVAWATQDEWDFPLWVRLAETVSYSNASPALAWTTTPLWSFLPAIIAPFIAMSHGEVLSRAAESVLLKTFFALTYLITPLALAQLLPTGCKRKPWLALALFNPLSLSALAWGTRDIVSGLLTLCALSQARRGRLVLCVALLALGGSIDEYYLPLLLVPALMAVAARPGGNLRWVKSALLLGAGIGPVIAQWAALPRAHSVASLAFRANYEFGEATWEHLLAMIGVFPRWMAGHELIATLVPFALITTAGVAGFLTATRADRTEPCLPGAEACFNRCLVVGAASTLAFFLSYSHVDPQEWYGALMVLLVCCARGVLPATYAIVFAWLGGAYIYAHFGLREMLAPWLFTPSDVSLVGIRGDAQAPLLAAALAVIGGSIATLLWATIRLRGGQDCFGDAALVATFFVWGSVVGFARHFLLPDALVVLGFLLLLFVFARRIREDVLGGEPSEPIRCSVAVAAPLILSGGLSVMLLAAGVTLG